MKNKLLFSGCFLIVLFSCSSSKTDNNLLMYSYSDGNNNLYKIYKSTISYLPVKPAESSSGVYDGGEEKTAKINASQFKEIETKIVEITLNSALQSKQRTKGTSLLKDIRASKNYILVFGKETTALESFLKMPLSK